MDAFLQTGLLAWFFFSLYAVYNDTSISEKLRIIGEITNILIILYIICNMVGENDTLLFIGVGALLLLWYGYYTPQDFSNTGYTKWERIAYGTVDICVILYLMVTLWFARWNLIISDLVAKADNIKYSFSLALRVILG